MKCSTCSAEFGIKFDKLVCSCCENVFCTGHFVKAKYLKIDKSIQSELPLADGLCYQCIFQVLGKADSVSASSKGVIGRITNILDSLWKKTKSTFSNALQKTDLIKISADSFEDINSSRSWSIFRHQQDVGYDFIIKDMTAFARLISINQGRKNEKDFSLNDIYRLIDWLKSHPNLPNWTHHLTWNSIESTPDGLAYFMDVWHVIGAVVCLSNPATGYPLAAYHLGDRLVDQGTGKGIFELMYSKIKWELGLNINTHKALVSYLAGLFILQLFSESEET